MKIPNLDMNKKENNNNYLLIWPFRMVIIGDSSRGKSNLVMYMILCCKFFNRPDLIYYYGRKLLTRNISLV